MTREQPSSAPSPGVLIAVVLSIAAMAVSLVALDRAMNPAGAAAGQQAPAPAPPLVAPSVVAPAPAPGPAPMARQSAAVPNARTAVVPQVGPGTVPPPLDQAAVATMGAGEVRAALAAVARARRLEGLDAVTQERLSMEFNLLLERAKSVR
jgi:hypothetical protein